MHVYREPNFLLLSKAARIPPLRGLCDVPGCQAPRGAPEHFPDYPPRRWET